MNKSNFLSYVNLSQADAKLFSSAGLNYFPNYAYLKLFLVEKPLDNRLKYLTGKLDSINLVIEYVLGLIGEHSNQRFGTTALEQHKFFQRPGEQETFLIHLFIAIQAHKKAQIIKANPKVENEINAAFMQDMHLAIRKFENKKFPYFRLNRKAYTEKQLYAAGVLYTINFVFNSVKINDARKTSLLIARIFNFINGNPYASADGLKGSKKTQKKKLTRKDKAYQIFKHHKLPKKFGNKKEALAAELFSLLPKGKKQISQETLRTRWVPEFVRKYALEV